MMPFVAIHLSPATYLPRWTWLEKTHQFGIEVGIKRGNYAVSMGYGSMYMWENVRSPDEALSVSSYYVLYNLTLYCYARKARPFISLSLAKPVITGLRNEEIREFNSSLRGTAAGLRAGMSYVWRYSILSIAPTVGLSYYPNLPVYMYGDGKVGLRNRVGVLRAFAYVNLGLGK